MSEDQFQTLKQMIESMRSNMDARFEQVERNFDQVERGFEQVDTRFTEVERRLDRLESSISLKPDQKDIYQAMFTIVGGIVVILAGAFAIAGTVEAFN